MLHAMRERRLFFTVLFAFLILTAAPCVHAQSGKITALHVTGSKHFASEQIAAMSGLKPGDTVTKDDIQAGADRLAALGPFLNVTYRFRPQGNDGVEIEFQLQDAPLVPVAYDNFPWFTDKELNDALRNVVPFFDGTAPEQGAILDLMNEALEKLLGTRNVKGTIERTLLGRPDSGGMMVQFKVAGASLRVNGLQFGHPLAGEDRRVRERLDDIVGKAYSRFAIEVFLREQVRPVYLERGHLNVKFGTPEPRFTGNPNRPLEDNVLVVVPVETGPAYKWGGAEWTGDLAFGPAALNTFLGMMPGEVVNGMKLEAGFDRVRNEYARTGYLDCVINSEAAFDNTGGKVTYRVGVIEGAQYRMGEMVITGLSLAAEKQLLAAWRIAKGQVFDKMYFEDFVEKGVKLLFADTPVHYDELGRWLRTNPETKTVDVLLDFK